MRTGLHALLILAIMATTASAQTPNADATSTAQLLNDQINNAQGSNTISNHALILGLLEIDAAAASAPELPAEVNQRRAELQLTAPSNSPNAISVLEKPGFADLLSLALDRGAIKKAANGTGLTLSTTPYAFWTGFGGARDTPQFWKRAVVARNLSFSATFSSSDDVTNGDFSSFSSGEIKYVIAGNRSPRDPELLRPIRVKLSQSFLVSDDLMEEKCKDLMDSKGFNDAWKEMNNWMAENKGASEEDIRKELDKVVEQIPYQREQLKTCADAIVKGEKTINASLKEIKEATDAYLDERRNQFSVAALFIRDSMLSDYYAGKLLYGRDFGSTPGLLSGNLNAEVDWNKDSETVTGVPLRSLRAYSVELGLTGTYLDGRLDGSLSSKASRDKALDSKSIVIGEAKLNLHLNDVLRLPLSLTYANRETQTIRPGWQFNVGISALLDQVLGRHQ